MGNQGTNLEQFVHVLRRRWRLLLACVVLVGLAAVGFSLIQAKLYTASASLLFRDTQFDQELFGSNFTPSSTDPQQQQATNLDLASLPTVATRTAVVLHLPASLVASEVTVSGVGQSNIAQISVTDLSPRRAAQIADTYAQQYVLYRQDADREKIAGAQTLVQKELAALKPSQRSRSVGTTLQNRANQLGVLASLQTGNAEVAQTAQVPTSPSTPKTKRNAALGLLLGLLLGAGLAFGSERFDKRVREPSELEDTYQVPLLGVVPESRAYEGLATDPLPVAEAEAFALLRARLRYFNVDRDIRCLLVISAGPNEGKTTVASNLAIAEAVAGNQRVVLLDADLRRPTVAKRLGIGPGPGLAEMLSRNATLEDALCEVALPTPAATNGVSPSLHVITSGAVPPNPAQLVESRSMIDLLSALSERFDLVVIDSPPISVVSDAIPIIQLVSGVVIVGRIGTSMRDSAHHLRDHLLKLHSPTLGVIANAVPARGSSYYTYGADYYRVAREFEVEPSGDQARE
jgi:receptor protein-tyrosine kinase